MVQSAETLRVTLCYTDGQTARNFADGVDAAIEQKNPSIKTVSALQPVRWHTIEHTKGTLLTQTDIGSQLPAVE